MRLRIGASSIVFPEVGRAIERRPHRTPASHQRPLTRAENGKAAEPDIAETTRGSRPSRFQWRDRSGANLRSIGHFDPLLVGVDGDVAAAWDDVLRLGVSEVDAE